MVDPPTTPPQDVFSLEVTSLCATHIGASNLERHGGGGLRRRFAGKKCRPRDVFDQLSGINAIRYYLTIGE